MPSFEELLEKSKIPFLSPLSQQGTERLFAYLADELPATVRINVEYEREFQSKREEKTVRRRTRKLSIYGGICTEEHSLSRCSFETISPSEKASSVSGIAFHVYNDDRSRSDAENMIIGKLFDRVRAAINQYFTETLKANKDKSDK